MDQELLWRNVREAFEATLHTELRVLITMAVLLLAAYFLLRIASGAVALLVLRRLGGHRHTLTVQTSEETGRDTIWMNRKTIRELKLTIGDTIRIKGLWPNARGSDRVVRISYRKDGLDDWHVEMSAGLQRLLFRGPPADEVNPLRKLVFSPRLPKGGFQEFWNHPSEQLRFQNRLSVFLGLGFPLFQMAWTAVTGA